jgi:hypothetical protein
VQATFVGEILWRTKATNSSLVNKNSRICGITNLYEVGPFTREIDLYGENNSFYGQNNPFFTKNKFTGKSIRFYGENIHFYGQKYRFYGENIHFYGQKYRFYGARNFLRKRK